MNCQWRKVDEIVMAELSTRAVRRPKWLTSWPSVTFKPVSHRCWYQKPYHLRNFTVAVSQFEWYWMHNFQWQVEMCEWISSSEFAWIYLKKVENVVSLTCRLCHLLFSLDGLKETATSLLEVKTWRLLPKYGEKNKFFHLIFFSVNTFFSPY